MRVIEQLQKALSLLELAKDDLTEWVESVEDDDTFERGPIEDTKELIAEIEDVLQEIE